MAQKKSSLLKGKKYAKADEEMGAEGEGEEEGEEDEGDAMKAKKSLVSETDLEKGLEALEAFAKSATTDRKAELLQKAQSSELSKSEADELYNLLGNKPEAQPDRLSDDVVKSLSDNDSLQKALDVSDYLEAQHDGLVKSLGLLADRVQEQDSRQHEFNLVLSKAMVQLARRVDQALSTLDGVASQPARAPKSAGVSRSQVLTKSFAGQEPGEKLSKGQVLDGMEMLLRKSGDGVLAETGENILNAISRYESLNQISPTMLRAVQAIVAH